MVFSAKAGIIRGYLNGSLIGQQPLPADGSALGFNDLLVAGFSNESDANRTEIGEVTIWKRALAAFEVANMYNAVAPKFQATIQASKMLASQSFPTEPLSIVHSTINDLKLLQSVTSQAPPIPRMVGSYSMNSIMLTVYGQPGVYYALQSSANLKNWTTYTTSLLEGSSTNIALQSPQMYFRAFTH